MSRERFRPRIEASNPNPHRGDTLFCFLMLQMSDTHSHPRAVCARDGDGPSRDLTSQSTRFPQRLQKRASQEEL